MQRRDKEKTLDTLAPTEGEHEPVVGDHFQRLSLADDLLRGAEAIAEHLYGQVFRYLAPRAHGRLFSDGLP